MFLQLLILCSALPIEINGKKPKLLTVYNYFLIIFILDSNEEVEIDDRFIFFAPEKCTDFKVFVNGRCRKVHNQNESAEINNKK